MKTKTKIEITIEHENMNLMGLVNQIKGVDKVIVEKLIYAIEDDMVEELCGEEYERTRYQRHDHKNRTLKTSIGTLELSLRRVKDKETVEEFPLLEAPSAGA